MLVKHLEQPIFPQKMISMYDPLLPLNNPVFIFTAPHFSLKNFILHPETPI
jgi:hypothetical protein